MEIGALLTLLGATWVTFVPVASFSKTLNEIRDKVLSIKPDYSIEHRLLMLRNDWLPVYVGACFHLIVVGIAGYLFPHFIKLASVDPQLLLVICYAFATFSLMRGFLFGISSWRDYKFMHAEIGKMTLLIEKGKSPVRIPVQRDRRFRDRNR